MVNSSFVLFFSFALSCCDGILARIFAILRDNKEVAQTLCLFYYSCRIFGTDCSSSRGSRETIKIGFRVVLSHYCCTDLYAMARTFCTGGAQTHCAVIIRGGQCWFEHNLNEIGLHSNPLLCPSYLPHLISGLHKSSLSPPPLPIRCAEYYLLWGCVVVCFSIQAKDSCPVMAMGYFNWRFLAANNRLIGQRRWHRCGGHFGYWHKILIECWPASSDIIAITIGTKYEVRYPWNSIQFLIENQGI